MIRTTMGQVLVNEALPEELRDHTRIWNKQTTKEVLKQVAEKYPDQYKDITSRLLSVGESAATTGNFSLSLKDFAPTKYKKTRNRIIREKVQNIVDNPAFSDKQRRDKITLLLGKELPSMVEKTLEEAVNSGSQLAELVRAGSKGSPSQFNSVAGSSLMFVDHKGNPIAMPILNSISEGLSPSEYWAGSYGTRTGAISTKFSTRDAGYFGKRIALALQRGVITREDCGTKNGILEDGGDPENVGTVLQVATAGLPAGTVIQPGHLKKLKGSKIVIRSPITCQAADGMCSKCAGIREKGKFPEIGENIGLASAMVLSERLSQTMLNVKHTGGAAGKKSYSFEDVDRLFEMPKHFIRSAAISTKDGKVTSIDESPTGGYNINIEGENHWVQDRDDIDVEVGQNVEAGDVLSKGLPNMKDLAKYRGIGDARKQFVKYIREVAGKAVTRRNAEVIARSMISHVAVNDPKAVGDNGLLAGDVVKYDSLVKKYMARPDAEFTPMNRSKGRFLEQPLLHYSIGTKINKRVLKDLKSQGITQILTHELEPGFEPNVRRMYEHSQMDKDWMARLSGYQLSKNFLKGVHRGDVSELASTSYVPGLVRGTEFGKSLETLGKY